MSHTETHVKPLTTSQQSRAWAGPAIFSYGFRPFFLFGAAWAAGAMVLWMLMLSGVLMLPTRFDPVLWHAHEFLYGYIGAIIAGFLLTAVPNWTGRLPVVGWALAGLFALWVTGRVAVATSALWPAGIVAGIDLSFPTVLGGVILREIVAGKNWRNLVILALLALFALSNLLFHMEAAGSGIAAGGYGQRLGVSTVIMMIAVIGGRVIPSFTRNWLVQQKSVHLPVPPMRGFDKITLGVTLLALGLWVVLPDHRITGAALVVIGVLHFIRVVRWQGWQTLSEPLLLVLHLAYIFVPAGAVAIGLSQLWPDAVSVAAAQHLWMAGAGGLMTLAMMTRATLGHTGQTLRAGSGTVAIYLALIGSTIARVCAGFMFGSAMVFYSLSALLWVFAFAGFAVLYGPCLIRPKPARA
ncbi:NnrS family protein [uncultured Sulfitobacter sp.]|uniref:NnrS family protein n=1 Tax=uncultured Sulfitobacter sp. TaxID=191468 RepID=UPI00260177C5|nr:NnrS family protein [uncultured Sulfitobacter sp.]